MVFGYFDYLILGILIILNIKFWKTLINWKIGCLIGILLFGLILPFISIIIELGIVEATTGKWMDSFEVIYTILRFPIYWLIGMFQVILIGISMSNKNVKSNEIIKSEIE